MHAELAAAFNELLILDHGERLAAYARSQRIPAEGRAVATWLEQIHHRVDRNERGYGQQPTAERFADDHAVGANAFVHIGEPLAGAAEAGLNFIQDEQHVALVRKFAHCAQETGGR